jgi:hypothetical protein
MLQFNILRELYYITCICWLLYQPFKRRVKSHLPFTSIIRRFNVYGSVHRKYIPVYIQQDATLHSLFISGNCSTCFGWYFHPSPGAHTTVSTASGICHTVAAICRCAVGGVRHPQHTQTGSNSSTIAADSSNGVTNTRRCRYRSMRSWWWVEVPPEICRAVSRYNLNCVTLHLVGYILEYY